MTATIIINGQTVTFTGTPEEVGRAVKEAAGPGTFQPAVPYYPNHPGYRNDEPFWPAPTFPIEGPMCTVDQRDAVIEPR